MRLLLLLVIFTLTGCISLGKQGDGEERRVVISADCERNKMDVTVESNLTEEDKSLKVEK